MQPAYRRCTTSGEFPARRDTSATGTPAFNQLVMQVCRRSYGRWASGESVLSGAARTAWPPATPASSWWSRGLPALVGEEPTVRCRPELLDMGADHGDQHGRDRHWTVGVRLAGFEPAPVVPETGVRPLRSDHRARLAKGQGAPTCFARCCGFLYFIKAGRSPVCNAAGIQRFADGHDPPMVVVEKGG